jgi:hypothetical protein
MPDSAGGGQIVQELKMIECSAVRRTSACVPGAITTVKTVKLFPVSLFFGKTRLVSLLKILARGAESLSGSLAPEAGFCRSSAKTLWTT